MDRDDGFAVTLGRRAVAGLVRIFLMEEFIKRNSSDRLMKVIGLSSMLESLS